MKVKFVDVAKSNSIYKKEIIRAINKVIDRGDYVLGREVELLEKHAADYCGTKYAVTVNSGTDALILSLKALGIGKGDEIITAPNSFIASASSIAVTGAEPVFADVREDYNIDPALIEKKITKKTKAIIPVHLTGKPAEMDAIMKIAKKYGLYVIEDAAQAIGARYKNKSVGSFGTTGCFSLHPLKNLSVIGDGGIITTNNKKIYEKLLLLRNLGIKSRGNSTIWAGNSRLDTLQAAVCLAKFKYIDEINDKKRKIADKYCKALKEFADFVPEEQYFEKQVYQLFMIQIKSRNKLLKYLKKKGIEAKVHYPLPIHLQTIGKRSGYKMEDFPITEKLAKSIVSLPISFFMTDKEINYVIKTIKEFCKGRK